MSLGQAAGQERNGLGIVCMLGGAFCLATNDAFAKWLGADYPIAQVVFFRSLFALPLIVLMAQALGGLRLLRPKRWWLHGFRGLLMAVSAFTFFAGLRELPLSSAWAIAFTAPLIMTALSPVMLGEPVGWRRWSGVLAGFAGVLVVVRPGLAAFQPASLLILFTAVCYALNFLTARKYAASETTMAFVFYTSVVPVLLAGAVMPFGHWTTPTPGDWGLFAAMGLVGGLAMVLLTQAFRLAPAAVVAPFDYSAMIWAIAYDWLVWMSWPDRPTWFGAALIIAAGLYVLHRETVAWRRGRAR